MDWTIVDELIDFFYIHGPFIQREDIFKSSFSEIADYIKYNEYQEVSFSDLANIVLNSTRHYKILICSQEDICENEVGDVIWAAIIAVEDLASGEQITRWGNYIDVFGKK